MNPKVDLRELAVRRDTAPAAVKSRRSWHIGTRLVLPGLVLAGFLAVESVFFSATRFSLVQPLAKLARLRTMPV